MKNFVRVKRFYPGKDKGHEAVINLEDIVYAEPFGDDGDAVKVVLSDVKEDLYLEISFRAICIRLQQDPDFPL